MKLMFVALIFSSLPLFAASIEQKSVCMVEVRETSSDVYLSLTCDGELVKHEKTQESFRSTAKVLTKELAGMRKMGFDIISCDNIIKGSSSLTQSEITSCMLANTTIL